jgi:hypothetical protein
VCLFSILLNLRLFRGQQLLTAWSLPSDEYSVSLGFSFLIALQQPTKPSFVEYLAIETQPYYEASFRLRSCSKSVSFIVSAKFEKLAVPMFQ